ncbi:dihydroxy-acid dehydratase domain-containing protein, partial [Nocardia sp. NPDC004722]
MSVHPVVAAVTARIVRRSARERAAYLERINAARTIGPSRMSLACSNLAHGFAACDPAEKLVLRGDVQPNIAIVSSYNDLLSAHQPYRSYPDLLRKAVADAGGIAQFAGGVPAMCDGITQGRPGMELSLFSRDVIAMSTAIALAHDMFDGALLLGVCDKIVPGLVIGALAFGHLPIILVPAGPMPSGIPNPNKSRIRQLHAEGKANDADLMAAEAASYHAPGTCTFYGTANSNQLLMEVMGLHLPGSSFVPPNTPLREALTGAAGRRLVDLAASQGGSVSLGEMIDERVIVNGVVALLATGGSTNHTMHLVAIAAAAGIDLRWQDFDELSAAVPTLTRIYPNGTADVNAFHNAGGTGYLIGELLDAGLLHDDVTTVVGAGLSDNYRVTASLESGELTFRSTPSDSTDTSVLRSASDPFAPDGGLRVLTGSLGQAV